jgi:hypothetical protein
MRPARDIWIEPFGAMTPATRRIQPGQSLRLLASFERVPLYAVLGKRGFSMPADGLTPTRGRSCTRVAPEPPMTPADPKPSWR